MGTQQYQIPALQGQLQIIKDLKTQYEAAHSSFLSYMPETAHVRGTHPSSVVPRDAAARVDGDDLLNHEATHTPGTQPTCDNGCSPIEPDALLNAMSCQVRDLGATASMEQTAAFALATELDRRDACAVLTGQKTRYYVHQSAVSVGRTSVYKGKVRSNACVQLIWPYMQHNFVHESVCINDAR